MRNEWVQEHDGLLRLISFKVGALSNWVDEEDVYQELLVQALRIADGFKPEAGKASVYISMACWQYVSKLRRKVWKQNLLETEYTAECRRSPEGRVVSEDNENVTGVFGACREWLAEHEPRMVCFWDALCEAGGNMATACETVGMSLGRARRFMAWLRKAPITSVL